MMCPDCRRLRHAGECEPLKIVTSHIYPPIPIRDFDWCAHYEGEEENGGYGYGKTEDEAIKDFMLNQEAK